MNIKYNFSVLLFLFIFQLSYSQSVEKANKLLEEGNFTEAEDMFKKCIVKKKDIIPAKYGLGLIYFDKKFPDYNIITSYRNLKSASSSYQRLNKNDKQEIEKKFNLSEQKLQNKLNEVIDTAYNATIAANTVDAFNHFIADFKDEKRKLYYATKTRDQLAFAEAEQTNTYKGYDYFVRQYPEAEQRPLALKRLKDIGFQFYNMFTQDGENRTYLEFDELYSFVQIPDSMKEKDKYWAKVGSKLDLVFGFDIDTLDWVSEMIKVSEYQNYISRTGKTELAFVALQRLMEPAIIAKSYSAALDTLNRYKQYFGDSNKKINQLINILSLGDSVTIQSISNEINTDKDEYAPYISADGSSLYFCGKRRTDNLGGEDIYLSEFKDGNWTKPEVVRELCTLTNNEAPLSVTTDGNTLFLFKNSNIYFTMKSETGWTKPEQVLMLNTETEWEADAMLTADGKALLFVSDRPGGVGLYRPMNELYHGTYNGNTDIYVTLKNPYGWSEPKNLGTSINTFYSERSPFLHPDMKTLYFSSEGYGGMGRLDIYKSTRLSDTSWTMWSEPVHLGRDVNTSKDDWGYRITTDGKMAYFASYQNKNHDISVFELPTHLRPEMIASIEGKLADVNGEPVSGKIIWEDLFTQQIAGEADINPMDGKYFITMPLGKKYGVYISSEKFFPVSTYIDLRDSLNPVDIRFDFEVPTIDEVVSKGKPVKLNNLFFDHDKYELKPESFPELNRLQKFIEQHEVELIEIGGHTDNVGSDTYNKSLSEKRANAVKEYLVKQKCDESKLSTVGYGPAKPITDNATEEARALNRRVEVKILR